MLHNDTKVQAEQGYLESRHKYAIGLASWTKSSSEFHTVTLATACDVSQNLVFVLRTSLFSVVVVLLD